MICLKRLLVAFTGSAAVLLLITTLGEHSSKASSAPDQGSLFAALVPVIRHPRCVNCHSGGEFPHQDDDNHPHAMNVRRGIDGHGVTAEKCNTCHQDHNLPGLHMPPGAPDWHIPPPATQMTFLGRTDGQICRQIKDPAQNGGRSIDKIVVHITTDPLVQWAWAPGEGRNPAPTSHAEFLAKVKAWVAAGAPCPAP